MTALTSALTGTGASNDLLYLEAALDVLREARDEGVLPVPGWLERLLAHDARRGGGLAMTLRAYLDHGNVRRAAAVLHLHATTVRYRLQRIAEITGLDLHDPDQRIGMALALRIAGVRALAHSR
jgi:DNA-binding PucR family transcriptional regulator